MSPSLNRYRSLLVTYLKPQWPQVLLLIVFLLSSIGLELVNPQILRFFIDTAVGARASAPSLVPAQGALQTLIDTALLFLAVAFLSQAITVAETYAAENVGLTATNNLRADLTLHCLQLDPSFHNTHTPGELIERIDGDVATLGNFFSRFVVALLGNALLLIGVLIMLFRIDWRVGVTLTVFALISLVIISRLRNIATPYWEAERQASANLFGFLEERFSGTEDIRSSGATAYMMRGLHEHSRTLLYRRRTAAQVGLTSWASTLFLFAVGTAVALALGSYLFKAGAISIGTVYLIFGYTILLDRPIEQIVRQIEDLQEATASITRIRTLLDISSSIEDGTGEEIPPGALSVEYRNVSFNYVEDVPVLRSISLFLKPGEVLGLLGRTGSGKTTLTKLLARLYDPTQGGIRLGGVNIRDAHLANLRQHIGVVTQDIQLFHATVRDNLTLFDRTIEDQRIVQVLEDLGLGPWYKSLSQELDTKLAPGGSGLSAGEAQLLAFARVFLKDPGLVILDEASSRLDPATERRLEQAIDRLLEDRTAIIIAHRLGTVQRADTIMILEDGQICECGPRKELARDPDSRFSHLPRTGLEEART